MEAFSQFVSHVDSMIWSMVLVLLCLGVGLYLSIRMKFPQIRLLKEMVRLLGAKEESENGITPFQAFASFYEAVRHCPMTEEQETILARMVEEAEEEERV